MTEFLDKCLILGDLYTNYSQDNNFKDFIEFNDLGLPLAYLNIEQLCIPTSDGVRYIEETWDLFLAALEIEDQGFETLDEVLAFAEA